MSSTQHDHISTDCSSQLGTFAEVLENHLTIIAMAVKWFSSTSAVHPTGRVKLFDLFAEDNFRSTFFNSRRCRVLFIGRRSVNGSIKFIRFADVIADSTQDIISTRNIFVHPWGKYPTLIGPSCSKYSCRAYIPITYQKVLNQRCEHERLRLLWVERKIIVFERNLARVCDHMSDAVAMNYVFSTFNDDFCMGSSDNSPISSFPITLSSVTIGFSIKGNALNGFSVMTRGSVTTGLMSVGPLSD